jgi:hypothetical protein
MKNVFFAFAMFALLFSACENDGANPAENSFELGDTVTIAFNQTAVLESDDLKITFTGITEDSRCPTNVECVWEGRAVAGFKAEKKGDIRVFNLTNNEQSEVEPKQSIEVFGRTVKLLDVLPYPENPASIPAGDYKVKFVVI